MSNNPTTGRSVGCFRTIGMFVGVVLLGLLLAACDSRRTGEANGRTAKNASDEHEAIVDSLNRRAEETALLNSNAAIATKAKLDAHQQRIAQLTTNSAPGMQALAAAETAFTDRLQLEMKIYAEGCDALDEADVLNTTSLTNKALLATRRLAVRKFISAAEGFRQFSIDIERIRRAELTRHNVPSDLLEVSVREFRKGLRPGNSLAIQMRDMDLKHGQALLGLIDLLETRWGAWRHETVDGPLVFEDEKDVDKFRELVKTVNDADAKRILLRKRVQGAAK